ncbi:sphingosine-1-phosphate phosphatase 1 [Strigomonas culicis]|uniref:Sphingosine-1-phosphate phosphatase 1 n=1 Tax=Strigomonas culicis TaxID=28005 RepID=S9W5L4_9TRYP|nr:sphingosine-1-phosphate phosphatase 1 [Strigomonas culicis]|eukprot:EPY31125.1 sphingosine-1-phosphate phosphatase 1 [Strigomonas culicis]
MTGCMKDAGCCPRPPYPPIQIRGRKMHSKEYGFPSTHACYSAVFSFFVYHLLCRFFPKYPVSCFLFTVFYFLNVCFSRLYLGMHWVADVVGGWVCAFIIVLFNISFIDDLVAAQLARHNSPWWMYVLVLVLLYAVPAFHATPHEPCPCYVDSVRFSSVVCGGLLGILLFERLFKETSVKQLHPHIIDEFTWTFFVHWVTCIVVLVAVKEGSSYAARKTLRPIFMFLSGAYASKLPRWSRRGYIWMARCVGLLATDNNVSCYEKYIEAAQINTRLYPDCACGSPLVFPTGARQAITADDANNPEFLTHGVVARPHGPSGGRPVSPGGPHDLTAEQFAEREGFLTKDQVWPLRTHRHWWLREVHERTVSYFCTGFVITFVAPVILRVFFRVGFHNDVSSAAPA